MLGDAAVNPLTPVAKSRQGRPSFLHLQPATLQARTTDYGSPTYY